MTIAIQLDLFETYDDLEIMRRENLVTRDQVNNLRRGLFARFGQLEANFMRQSEEIDVLKRQLRIYEKNT